MTCTRILTHGLTLLCFGFVLLLSACDSGDGPATRGNAPLLANIDGDKPLRSGQAHAFGNRLNGPVPERRVVGSDEFLDDPNYSSRDFVTASSQGDFTLNLVNVPIAQAAKAVLGDALEKNYAIKPGVTGTVTLQTTRPLTARALLDTFQTVLELNGATLQRDGDIITIIPSQGAARRITNSNELDRLGARVVAVPLKYIGTAEMVRLLNPIAGSTVELQTIAKRNILLVSGNRAEINAAIDAINLFDVDILKGKSVGLFPLKAAEPEAVVEELQVIFENQEGGGLQDVISFLPSQQLGAVLVVTSRSRYLEKAERWIRDLDRAAGGATRRPVVYKLQNRSAEDLAEILSDMAANPSNDGGADIGSQTRVVADDTKNALIVWGNDSEQESFSRLIRSLDTTPVQVLLEATIAEVSLNDELNFGLRWFFENGDTTATFTDLATGGVRSSFPGLSVLFQGNSASVAINALNSVTDVNVVSSPSLMVVDNQEARLQIGDEVPIATQQVRDTTNPDAPVVNTISFRDTGIILTVKPRVNKSGQVVLDIEQEVSTVSNTTTSGIDSPTISTRKIETSVVVTDGETIALGGLIEEDRNETNSKVPIAGDVPVIGSLFRNRKDKVAKTELLVLITPRVVRNGQESRQVTAELRHRLGQAEGLVQNGVGTPSVGHRIID